MFGQNNGEKISNECEKHHNVMAYAVRFLKDNVELSSSSVHAEAPRTPDRLFDSGIMVFSENIEELQVIKLVFIYALSGVCWLVIYYYLVCIHALSFS